MTGPNDKLKRETDVALAEFETLRAEILAYAQAQAGTIAAALTATTALGTIALSRRDGPLEVLLVLPFVLSGLGLLYTDLSRRSFLIGHYIKTKLWSKPGVLREDGTRLTSWEDEAGRYRSNLGVPGFASAVLPFLLIFILPSAGSLVLGGCLISSRGWEAPLAAAFGLGLVSLALYAGAAVWVYVFLRDHLDDTSRQATEGREAQGGASGRRRLKGRASGSAGGRSTRKGIEQ